MDKERILKPFVNIGPGYTIKKFLDARGWTQEDLAQIIDISTKQLSQIVNSKARITIETAGLLAEAFETNAEFWINLDTQYRLNLESDDTRKNAAQRKARIRKYMPVSEILSKGWFDFDKTAEGYEALYKRIWNTNSNDDSVYETPEKKYCARQSREHEEYTAYYTLTWFQIAKSMAEAIEVPAYNEEKLKNIADSFTDYTASFDGIRAVLADLRKAGIKFFVLSHLSKTYLDGACFWDGDNPVVIYTCRYDRVDNFWFTLAHELSHVLLHLLHKKDQCFLDDLAEGKTDDLQEREADERAEKMLRVDEILSSVTPYLNYFSEAKLRTVSGTLGIEESVILGVLQHKGLVDYRKLNKFKTKVSELFPLDVVRG